MLIREAKPQDAHSVARVHVDTWRTAYSGIIPDDYLNGLSYEKAERSGPASLCVNRDNKCLYVAETDYNTIVGFAIGGAERGNIDEYDGELYAIYVLQEYQKTGIGKQLVSSVAQYLSSFSMNSMLVWVLEANSARGFYEHLGGIKIGADLLEIGGASICEIAYGWKDIGVLLDHLSN